MQAHGVDDDFTPSDNQFSADEYRIIHFVVDMPSACRGASSTGRRRARPLGNVIFVICEFQIVDRDTETHNELGEASHAKYKERQKKAVMRRLQLGGTGEARPKPRWALAGRAQEEVRRVERALPMRLYSGKVPAIATEVVRALLARRTSRPKPQGGRGRRRLRPQPVPVDEREVNERAKDVLERTGKPQSEYQRVRAARRRRKGHQGGRRGARLPARPGRRDADALEQRRRGLRRGHRAPPQDGPGLQEAHGGRLGLDAEVRAQLRHVKEGTREWEVEYARVLEQVKRKKGL
jgi:hypothetical protein